MLAITAETLFLVNLMLAPGLAFLVLLMLHLKNRGHAGPLAANHLSQTVGVSLAGGAVIVLVAALMLLFGDRESPYTWMIVILYFTFIHSSLILMGVAGLVKAMAGEHFSYPMIGRPFKS